MSWRTREELAHQVVTLKGQGMAARAIARALGVSRNTVKSLLIGHAEARETGHVALTPPLYRVCRIDGFVDWDGNRYAVPYDHVTDLLPVRVTQRELFVYAADLRCVARHELAPRGAGLSLDPTGIHPTPQRRPVINLDQIHVAFGNMGERSAEFFKLMSLGTPRAWSQQARQILMLRERYPTSDIDLALGRAASFGAVDFPTVERILAVHATPRTLDEYVAEETAQRIEQTLGKARTQPRDLLEYDRLPLAGMVRTPHQETTACPSEALPDDKQDPSLQMMSSSQD